MLWIWSKILYWYHTHTHTCSFIRWKVDRPQPQQWHC